MNGDDEEAFTEVVDPEVCGYLRRRDRDTQHGVAYEAPDGQITLFPHGRSAKLALRRPI